MMRAVLDTNVLVSALLVPKGNPARILDAATDLKFQLVISTQILDELREVLERRHIQNRFHLSAETINQYLTERLVRLAIIITPQRFENVISRDPDDDLLLACALESNADYLVSGDLDLLDLHQYRQIQIVTPARFIEILDALESNE